MTGRYRMTGRAGVPEYRCEACNGIKAFDVSSGEVYCHTDSCAAFGVGVFLVWRTGDLLAGGTADGWPRPYQGGRPVPWITPAIGQHVWWRRILPSRILFCQQLWACQLCGLDLGTGAEVLVNAEGRVIRDMALHPHCVHLARQACPAVSRHGFTCVRVSPAGIVSDGAMPSRPDAPVGEWYLRRHPALGQPQIPPMLPWPLHR